MASYVYMKLLEAAPGRYDRWIGWLSFGQSERIKRQIVDEHAGPGLRILEVGTGTGTLAVMAAAAGAEVVGFDISDRMLAVARKKVAAAKLADRVELHTMGIGQMDAFADASFDLVLATLVFSELGAAEQRYAVRHAFRVLKPGGKLVLADEVIPRRLGTRLLYWLLCLPLKGITFVISQTTTHAVHRMDRLVEEAGFRVEQRRRSGLDSFEYLVARKESPQ